MDCLFNFAHICEHYLVIFVLYFMQYAAIFLSHYSPCDFSSSSQNFKCIVSGTLSGLLKPGVSRLLFRALQNPAEIRKFEISHNLLKFDSSKCQKSATLFKASLWTAYWKWMDFRTALEFWNYLRKDPKRRLGCCSSSGKVPLDNQLGWHLDIPQPL